MKLIKSILAFLVIFMSSKAFTQSASTRDTFPTTSPWGAASIMSSRTPTGYQFYINGSALQWGTGSSGLNSPTHVLQNNTASTGRKFSINSSDAGAFQLIDITASNATRFLINNIGNIGIGTTSPNNKLEIDNTTTGTSGLRFTRLTSGSTTGASNGKLLSVNGNGDVVLNPDNWTLSGSYIYNNNSGNLLIGSSTDNGNKFQVTGNSYLSGNLGIGNTSPTNNLDVTGTGRFTSSVTAGSFIKSGGTSLQFLKADGTVDANTYITGNQTVTASGDVTGSGTTTLPLTLATVNSSVGSFTNPNITVDAKGRVTAVSNGAPGFTPPIDQLTGTGTVNYVSKFINEHSLGNSLIYDNGVAIGIGTTTPVANLEIKTASSNTNTNIITTSGFYGGYDPDRFSGTGAYSNKVIKSQIGLSSAGSDFGGLTYWNDGEVVGSGLTSFDRLICNYGHYTDQGNFFRLQNPQTNYPNYSLAFGNTVYPVVQSTMWQYGWGGTMLAWNMPLTLGSVSNYPVRIAADQGNANRPADIFIQNSKIGIGTETPTQRLDVNGNIYSNGKIAVGPAMDWSKLTNYTLAVNGTALFTKAIVKLYTAWPDYVFHENYKLPSLEEIEKYIKTNKHLPDVPSAREIEKNGIDLGDNQSLLMKKIEELTLIVIEQNKRIKILESKLNKL